MNVFIELSRITAVKLVPKTGFRKLSLCAQRWMALIEQIKQKKKATVSEWKILDSGPTQYTIWYTPITITHCCAAFTMCPHVCNT